MNNIVIHAQFSQLNHFDWLQDINEREQILPWSHHIIIHRILKYVLLFRKKRKEFWKRINEKFSLMKTWGHEQNGDSWTE